MLTAIIVGAIVFQSVFDAIRRHILMRTAVEVASRLGAPVLQAAAHASLHGTGREYQTLGDLQTVRSFLTSGTLISFMDVPFAPLFILAIFLDPPRPRDDRHRDGAPPDGGGAREPARDRGALRGGEPRAGQGQPAPQLDGAQQPGHQRDGDDPRSRAHLGQGHRRLAHRAGPGAGPQRRLRLDLPRHPAAHAGHDPRRGRLPRDHGRAHRAAW